MVQALLLGNPEGTSPTVGYARSGGGMYGQRDHAFLQPVISLQAQIRHLHVAEQGAPVGYDRSWLAPEDVTIATLALGFADGYSRENSNTDAEVGYGKAGKVGINGRICDIAGKVCMDMMMVNCGAGTPEELGLRVGDYAVLCTPRWGSCNPRAPHRPLPRPAASHALQPHTPCGATDGAGGPSLKEHAANLGTAQSDVTCDLTRRVRRSYINLPEPKQEHVKLLQVSRAWNEMTKR